MGIYIPFHHLKIKFPLNRTTAHICSLYILDRLHLLCRSNGMTYSIQSPIPITSSAPDRVGTNPKEISAGKSFNSNSFEAFLPKDWEKRAKEGYQDLVSLGLRPPSDAFPPPLELYKEWNEKKSRGDAVVTLSPVVTERGDANRQARYREKHRAELAEKEKSRRQIHTSSF